MHAVAESAPPCPCVSLGRNGQKLTGGKKTLKKGQGGEPQDPLTAPFAQVLFPSRFSNEMMTKHCCAQDLFESCRQSIRKPRKYHDSCRRGGCASVLIAKPTTFHITSTSAGYCWSLKCLYS